MKFFRVSIGLGLVMLTHVVAATPNSTAEAKQEHYRFKSVAIGGGGFVTGIIFNPTERGLCYVRTDVGGAYRRSARDSQWVPLMDWVGQADWNLMGIESLATDPIEPNRVYLAAGTYTQDQFGNGEMLRSSDYGATWRRTPVPFKMGGNEAGRGNGERLAVDPNHNAIIYFGSRKNGLWESENFGETWKPVTSFPNVADGSVGQKAGVAPGNYNYLAQAVGIVWVVFDPTSAKRGEPTRTIYAAVSTAENSLFRSIDAGQTWTAVPGQPKGLRPNHGVLSADGKLYLSYGKEPGPNSITDGAVWVFATASGEWTDITPAKPAALGEKFGYGAVTVDAEDPHVVLAATWNKKTPLDEIFRSTDSGAHWKPVLTHASWDHSIAPYTSTMHHHWLADLEIDPFDAGHVLFPTGYGLWATKDIRSVDTSGTSSWYFDNVGIEETVPLTLFSPPAGAVHLISGVGDIDGFLHRDLDVSPPQGRIAAPGYKNTESIAVAAAHPEILVRSGTTYTYDRIHAAYTNDGGVTWQAFKSEPPLPPSGLKLAGGPIALSADGQTAVWTPRANLPYRTTDFGGTWTACAGGTVGLRVIADPIDAKVFYAYETGKGAFLRSDDGAQTFTAIASGLPILKSFRGPPPGNVQATPQRRGDLWIVAEETLYHSTDGGRNFQKTESAEATALGFGRGPTADAFPSLFIVGKVEGRPGLYRSDDTGAHWSKLNDDQHQYGAISLLIGDPQIYGRVYFATGGRGIFYGDRIE